MPRRAFVAIAALLCGCTPQLGTTPFSCAIDGTCPEGYTCQSTVCVQDGSAAGPARPERVNWINAGEMYWLARPAGGAVLIVNDGFTPGAHGIYEIQVSPEGLAQPPRMLLGYGDEFPVASSVVALDSTRYVVATLRFPTVDEDNMTLEVLAIEREATVGTAPSIETLHVEQEPFLGGVEPAYIGAVTDQGTIVDIAWTRPSQGVELLRIEKNGSVWTKNDAFSTTQALPASILPLSGDCVLWKSGADELTVRVGFESFSVAKRDATGMLSPFSEPIVDAVPLYAFGDNLLLLKYGEYEASTASYSVTYALTDSNGATIEEDPGGQLQETLEPYTALPFEDGALFAPLSNDPAFPTLDVGFRSPSLKLIRRASIARTSSGTLYSARAFANATEGRVYVAWTEFHEALMDLWVATAGENSQTASGSSALSRGHRVTSWSVEDFSTVLQTRKRRFGGRP